MLRSIRGLLSALVDPAGPIGAVLSPADTFKERAGLPITAPHAQRANLQPPANAEQRLASARFVAVADAVGVPRDRVRQVSAFVEERWAPVYGTTDSLDLLAIFQAAEQLVGWKVTQHVIQRARRRSAEEELEVIRSAQVIPSDQFYNGVYETIPGNDPIVLDGHVLRGEATYDAQGRMTHDGIVRGTVISGGRAEYRERTRGFAHWDRGFWAERESALAEEASRPVRNARRALEATAGECLPMWRPVGINPRRDRRSAV